MVDTRFHPTSGPLALGPFLAARATRPAFDDWRVASLTIDGAEELDLAEPGEIGLAAQPAYRESLRRTAAGAVVVHPSMKDDVPVGTVAIIDEHPHDLFVDILEAIYPAGTRGMALALVQGRGPEPRLEEGVRLGSNVVIGGGAEIGRNTVIGPNSVIGPGVAIGRNAVIGPGVTVECAFIGNNVVLQAGARVGAEGFGWLDLGRGNRKIPQLGRAILQDGVEVGANSCIDRGALGDTVIGEGTKIDNLVQVGHNCKVGRRCLLAGAVGLSGGTIVGDHVLFGASSGSTGHLQIGTGSIMSARAVVTKDVPAGAHVAGYPAQDIKVWRRELALLRRLNKGDKSER